MNRPRKKDGHLPPCVYQKHGAYWHVKGKKWTRLPKEGPSTLTTAMEAYAAIFEVKESGIQALIDKTVKEHLRIEKLSTNTGKAYRSHANYLKKALREFHPYEVRPRHVVQIKRALAHQPSWCNQILSLGRVLFRYWLEDELVETNPFDSVQGFETKGRDRLPTPAEFAKVRAKGCDELQIIMDLWRGCGQRVMDVVNVQRIDTDLSGPGIRFIQQKTGEKLTVAWTPELRAAVQRARTLYGNILSKYLLHNRRGGPLSYDYVATRWTKACKAAGIHDLQRRDLRAMAATEAEEQGLDPQALLGHRSRQTTQRYLRDRKSKLVHGPSFRQAVDK